jgi:hypothetical protein
MLSGRIERGGTRPKGKGPLATSFCDGSGGTCRSRGGGPVQGPGKERLMKGPRRFVLVLLAAAGLLPATHARANLSATGVVSGGTLWWGANGLNSFTVANGSCEINSSATLPIVGGVVTTKGAGANAVFDGPAVQNVFDSLYVYYAAYNNNANFQIVVSHGAPAPEGYPFVGLTYTPPGHPKQVNSQTAVFLGSYVTDANGDMIPFRRHGDEVIVEGSLHTEALQQSFSFLAADAYPEVFTVKVGWPLPSSASALIVNAGLLAQTFQAGHYYAAILEPGSAKMTYTVPDPDCEYHAQVVVDNNYFSRLNAYVPNAKIFAPAGTIVVGACWGPPNGGMELDIFYRGYVETIHHMY